jgi:ABC-type Fe3+/spermidine/putrescine transport system ATPase subunit
VGTPEELYRRPASPFVATFFGEARFVPVTWDAAARRLRGPLGDWPLEGGDSAALLERLNGDGRARLLLRPESWRLAADPQRGAVLRGRVRSATFLGGRRRLAVEVAGLAEPLQVDLSAAAPVAAGDTVPLELDLGAVSLLPESDFPPSPTDPSRRKETPS